MAQIVRNDVAAVVDSADELLNLSNEHGLAQPRAAALAYLGWALGQAKDVDQGVSLLEQGLAAWERLGIRTNLDFYICLLAETYFEGRRYGEAMEKADLAIATSSEIGDRWCLPRIHLVRGQLLQQTSDDPDSAEESLRVFGAHRLLILAAGIGPLQRAEHGPRYRDRSATMVLFTD